MEKSVKNLRILLNFNAFETLLKILKFMRKEDVQVRSGCTVPFKFQIKEGTLNAQQNKTQVYEPLRKMSLGHTAHYAVGIMFRNTRPVHIEKNYCSVFIFKEICIKQNHPSKSAVELNIMLNQSEQIYNLSLLFALCFL